MTLSPLWNRDKESEKYLLELGIVGSLSDSVSQRDFSVSKQAYLVSSCLKEEQKNNICWFLFQRTTANVDPAFRFPSAVNRRRLQVPQNCSDIEVMNPTWARFEDHRLTYEIREPDLAQKAGYFPPLRRVVWSVFHPLERGERLPDDLQHLLRVKVRSDTLSCNCAELDRPDRAPSFPCSNGCRRKACTRWNGRRCCWKEKKLSLYLDSVLGSYNFAVAGDWLTGAWFSQQNWWSRLRSGPAWPHSSPGHVGDS